jgi:hypothetical protein
VAPWLVVDGVGELELHQLYRAMGWLGDELADQSERGLGPRTTRDFVEERLCALRNNLFREPSAAKGGSYPLPHLYETFGLVRLTRLGRDVPWVKA